MLALRPRTPTLVSPQLGRLQLARFRLFLVVRRVVANSTLVSTTRARAEKEKLRRYGEGVDPRVGAELGRGGWRRPQLSPVTFQGRQPQSPVHWVPCMMQKCCHLLSTLAQRKRRVCRLLCWQHVAMAAAFRRTQAALTWLKRCSKEVSTSTAIGHRSMQQEKDRRRRRSYVQVSN